MELLIATALLAIVATSVSAFLVRNIRHSGKLKADQALTATARDDMEDARRIWAVKANFTTGEGALPTVPTDCVRQVATPSVTVTVGGTSTVKTLTSRQLTLTCTKNGYSQSFSLEIPEP